VYTSLLMGSAWPEELVDVKIADRMRTNLEGLRRTPAPDVVKYMIVLHGEQQHAAELRRRAESETHG
jgi:hypothetical protein